MGARQPARIIGSGLRRMRKRIMISCLLGAAGLLTTLQAQPTQTGRAELLLQQAIHREIADGDLEQAIALYQAAIAAGGDDRRLVAQALLHLGRCYEKLGRAEARRVFERVVREYADQRDAAADARARLSALDAASATKAPSTMMVRRVSARASLDGTVGISSDGRYLSEPDWDTGNLVLIDVATGRRWPLTTKRSWFDSDAFAETSAIAPDDKRVAYVWFNEDGAYEIRLVGIDGSPTRIVLRNEEIGYIPALEWAPDGRGLAAVLQRKDGTNQIALVALADGAVRALKTLDWRYPSKFSFSPDGRYLAYDLPPRDDAPERDIFVLAVDGSRETTVVQHPANDFVLGWAPDGRRLVFGSDRSGTVDAWFVDVMDGRPQGQPELIRPDMGRSWPIRLTPNGSYYYGVPMSMTDVYIGTLDSTLTRVLRPPVQATKKFVGFNRYPEWSPDGTQLAYISQFRPGQPQTGTLALTIQSLETGQQRQLFPKLNYFSRLRWSPDGRWILTHARDLRNRGGLFRIDIQTGEATLVGRTGGGYPRQSAWFPDGKSVLYFWIDSAGTIRRLDLDSGEERAVYPGADFALAPDGRQMVVCEDDRPTKTSVLNLVSLAGGPRRELMRSEGSGACNHGCAWTPDSRHVLCVKAPPGAKPELWRISIEDGSRHRLLAMDNLGEIRVHPDGRRIAFTSGTFRAELWVMENFLPPARTASASRRP